MKPTKQTLYLPVENGVLSVYNWESESRTQDIESIDGYFFTPEQLNEYTQSVIKQALETAAEKVKLIKPDRFGICESSVAYTEEGEIYISSKSITNTFEETFKLFEL